MPALLQVIMMIIGTFEGGQTVYGEGGQLGLGQVLEETASWTVECCVQHDDG